MQIKFLERWKSADDNLKFEVRPFMSRGPRSEARVSSHATAPGRCRWCAGSTSRCTVPVGGHARKWVAFGRSTPRATGRERHHHAQGTTLRATSANGRHERMHVTLKRKPPSQRLTTSCSSRRSSIGLSTAVRRSIRRRQRGRRKSLADQLHGLRLARQQESPGSRGGDEVALRERREFDVLGEQVAPQPHWDCPRCARSAAAISPSC